MGGWMEVLVDKVHKQGEHIPQHTFHTTIPTYVAVDIDIVPPIACHSYLYVEMVEMFLSAGSMHIFQDNVSSIKFSYSSTIIGHYLA